MSNLLKKASIITTPTAYDNGRILSVKPNENIYGSELVTNGNFSNGTTGWSSPDYNSTLSIVNGQMKIVSTISLGRVVQAITTEVGKKYLVSATTTNIDSSTGIQFKVSNGANLDGATYNSEFNTTTSPLTITHRFVATATTTYIGSSQGSSVGQSALLDNVSVVEDLSGDFDFERGSAATRVNAQGLVENVQILSSELVQNGNFSEIGSEEVSNGNFSQEGSELVTGDNSNFDTSTGDWQQFRGVLSWDSSIQAGKWTDNGSSGSPKGFTMSGGVIPTSVGKIYRVKFIAKTNSSSSFNFGFIGETSTFNTVLNPNLTSDFQDYEFTFTTSGNNQRLYIALNSSTIGNGESYWIDNVSVKEVGQDWNLSSTFSIAENKLRCVSDGSYQFAYQNNVFTVGKTYKVTFDILDYASGSIRVRPGGGAITSISANGSYTLYYTIASGGTQLFVERNGACDMSITNISVKEVGQGWTLTNGSISDKYNASMTAYQTGIKITPFTKTGKYKVVFDLVVTSGSCKFDAGGGEDEIYTTSGTKEILITNPIKFEFNAFNLGWVGSLDNVSVVEVTDDTDLPRINYEGFSYQDVFGSELITNGDFAVDGSWVKGTGWTISGGSANGSSTTGDLYQENVVESGKYYKVTYTISNYVSGSVRVELPNNSHAGTERSANGTYTETILSGGTIVLFDARTSFTGSIDNVSVKEYLGQEVVPNSGCGSWLFEPQSTNLIPNSENLTDGGAGWINQLGGTVVANQYSEISGKYDAWQLNKASGTFKSLRLQKTLSNSTYTLFWYLKKGNIDKAEFRFDGGLGAQYVLFNLLEGTHTENTNLDDIQINSFGDWYKCQATITTNLTNIHLYINTSSASTDAGYIYAQYPQIEQLPYATSYIPTNGAASTRLQDIANNSGNSTLINSTEGVLYVDIAALTDLGSYRLISLNSDNSSSNRITIAYDVVNNQIYGQCVDGGVSQALFTTQPTSISDFNKIALKYKANDLAFWVNGFEVGTNTSASIPTNLNRLSFDRADAAAFFFGKTKALAVWKEALTDTELELLTAPAPEFPTFSLDFDTIAEQFTFTRGSEATFVNEQGLIQSTNELGAELVTNGNFATDSDWSLGTGWSIANGKASCDGTQTSNSIFYQNIGNQSNKTVKISFTISNYISGILETSFFGASGTITKTITANGDYTFYINVQSGHNGNTGFTAKVGFVGSIDNISIKEVISATNTPRIDYSTGVEAFLLEPQSTNLVTYSEDLTNFSSSSLNVTINPNQTTSPSGNLADKMEENNVDGSHAIRKLSGISVTASQDYTFSFFAKKDERSIVGISNTVGGNAANAFIDIENGVILSSEFNTSSIDDYGNGWYRISLTDTATNTTDYDIRIYTSTQDGNFSHQGVVGYGFYIWGISVEQQSYATSYIPTDGASATRNQETCVDATPTINSEEGVLYAEISALANDGTFREISLNDGTTNNVVEIRYTAIDNAFEFIVRNANTVQVASSFTLTDATQFNKIAFSYKTDDYKMYVNGVEAASDTSGTMPSGLNKLSFNWGGFNPFFGNTKGLQLFDKALSDYQLKQLTTI